MATNETASCRNGSICASVTSENKKRKRGIENSNDAETNKNCRTKIMSKSLAITICNIGTCAGRKIASEVLDILSDPNLSLTDFRKMMSNYEECTKVMDGILLDGNRDISNK